MLRTCYDLSIAPASFDFVSFLLDIERERIARGEQKISIAFRRGPVGGFRNDRFWPASVQERQGLFENVVLPMAKLLPSVDQSGQQLSARGDYGYGVRKYGADLFMKALASGVRPLRAPRGNERSDHVVTITLRECEHWPERNSNVAEWILSADAIERMGFDVVFVRDTRMADETQIGHFVCDPVASRDLTARASLYSAAVCNLFVNNGPAWLSIALDAPTIIVKPTTESLGRCYSSAYFASIGVPNGAQLPASPSHQRMVWADDEADVIVSAFKRFIGSN